MRVGWGIDAHRFSDTGTVVLAGIVADDTRGIEATSDGDVVAHALCDALLGAAALGDLGEFFPSDAPESIDADSMQMLASVQAHVRASGYSVASVDVTVVAERVRVSPIRDSMRASIASVLELDLERVSVKATTTDGLGFTGRDEGLATYAVVVLEED